MDLPSPSKEEIDGSLNDCNDPGQELVLPYVFGGRQFSPRNDLFLHSMLEFHETWFRPPDININTNINKSSCSCPGFIKCQHLIVHNPSILTYEFAQKTWLQSILNYNKNNVFVRRSPIKAGNTSTTRLAELIYVDNNNKEYPLLSCVLLGCHVNADTLKPIRICETQRNYTNNMLSTKTKNELIEIDNLNSELKTNLDKLTALLSDIDTDSCLFKCNIQIQYTDIDSNYHVNQSVYGKFIENTLYQYCNDYSNDKYHISSVTMNYVHEMIIKIQNILPFCMVKIIKDNIIKPYIKREITGIIEKDNILCLQFKIVLIKYKHDRLFIVRSRL